MDLSLDTRQESCRVVRDIADGVDGGVCLGHEMVVDLDPALLIEQGGRDELVVGQDTRGIGVKVGGQRLTISGDHVPFASCVLGGCSDGFIGQDLDALFLQNLGRVSACSFPQAGQDVVRVRQEGHFSTGISFGDFTGELDAQCTSTTDNDTLCGFDSLLCSLEFCLNLSGAGLLEGDLKAVCARGGVGCASRRNNHIIIRPGLAGAGVHVLHNNILALEVDRSSLANDKLKVLLRIGMFIKQWGDGVDVFVAGNVVGLGGQARRCDIEVKFLFPLLVHCIATNLRNLVDN